MRRLSSECDGSSRMMLGCASLLVQRKQRGEWIEEWRSELWYVLRANKARGNSILERERQSTIFCLGAFRDALCIQQERRKALPRTTPPSRSAVRCIATLSFIAVASLITAFLLPDVRTLIRP